MEDARLPTEQEKVAFFDSLGIDRRRLPRRLYHGANGNQTRYFALKLPIAPVARTAIAAGTMDMGATTSSTAPPWPRGPASGIITLARGVSLMKYFHCCPAKTRTESTGWGF